MSHSTVLDSNYTPPYISSLDNSDYSTGYLQDALFEFSSKPRRLVLLSDDQTNYSTSPIQSFWNGNFSSFYHEDFAYLNQSIEREEDSGKMINNNNAEVETFEEQARPGFEGNTRHSSSSSANSKDSFHTDFGKANASSGIGVAAQCKGTFLELQRKKVHRYVIFKIDEKKNEVVVEKTGDSWHACPLQPLAFVPRCSMPHQKRGLEERWMVFIMKFKLLTLQRCLRSSSHK